MIYVDSNIFIHAIIDRSIEGTRAREFLKSVQNGKEKAYTSALTYDEIVWRIWKLRSYEDALSAARSFIHFSNLTFIEINHKVLTRSLELMENYKIYPRDAIHVACALENGIFIFLSQDKGFDKIKELKRKAL